MSAAAGKARRHQAILELVAGTAIPNQTALARELRWLGHRVTQATLSRDLKELRVSRVPTPDGYRYVVADAAPASTGPAALRLAESEVTSIESNENMVVLRTLSGRAQGVGVYLDGLKRDDVLGTLAGDDTVLVLPKSVKQTRRLRTELERLLGFTTN